MSTESEPQEKIETFEMWLERACKDEKFSFLLERIKEIQSENITLKADVENLKTRQEALIRKNLNISNAFKNHDHLKGKIVVDLEALSLM